MLSSHGDIVTVDRNTNQEKEKWNIGLKGTNPDDIQIQVRRFDTMFPILCTEPSGHAVS